MAEFIRAEDIEDSIWIYLYDLEELNLRIIMYELDLERRILQLQLRELRDFSDNENWYSD